MKPILVVLLVLGLAACKNSAEKAGVASTSETDSTAWSLEDERQFLAACVENASGRYREDSAYAHCKCVLERMKREFPSMDSASRVLSDTAKASAFAAPCR